MNSKYNKEQYRQELKENIRNSLLEDKIVTNSIDLSTLHLAVLIADISLIKKYLTTNNVNSIRGRNSSTPLHILFDITECEVYKKIEILKLLCSFGANVNIKDNDGESCLYKVTRDVSEQYLVIELINHGAYVLENDKFYHNDLILFRWINKAGIQPEVILTIKNLIQQKLYELDRLISVY